MQHRKVTTATIARPLPEVFDWVTTPGYWPLFWPVTLGVDVAEPWRPFRVGDHCREHIQILAWRGHFDWTVDVVERPHKCVLTAVSGGDTMMSKLVGQNTGRIEYTLDGDDRTTQFHRDMSYPIEGMAAHLGDLMGFGRAVDHACDVALATMVSMLENPYLRGPQPDVTSETLLHEADPLADEAVASLVSPSGDLVQLEGFLGSLYRTPPSGYQVPEGPMRRFLEATGTPPAWACAPRLDAASGVFLDWGPLTFASHVCASLPETYQLPRTAKLLDLTRQLDRDAAHVDRRLWFTVRMIFDVLSQHGLSPGNEGVRALQRLRLLHAMVRLFVQRRLETPYRLSRLADGGLWDSQNGLPISQLELLHTLLTFSHVVIRSLDIWGCNVTPYQREAYIHAWNVAGALAGIKPELLPRNSYDAGRMFEAIKARYGGPTPEAERLGRALLAFWTDVLPRPVRGEAAQLMQYVISTLISPETARINGLDHLPAFPETARTVIHDFLSVRNRVLSQVFADAPPARSAAALLVSLLVRKESQTFEDDSGIFDIPDDLHGRWMKEA